MLVLVYGGHVGPTGVLVPHAPVLVFHKFGTSHPERAGHDAPGRAPAPAEEGSGCESERQAEHTG